MCVCIHAHVSMYMHMYMKRPEVDLRCFSKKDILVLRKNPSLGSSDLPLDKDGWPLSPKDSLVSPTLGLHKCATLPLGPGD